MKFTFVGAAAVDVPAIGAVDVQPGQVVTVDDLAVSKSMGRQPDLWERIPDQQSSRAKKASAT